MSLVKYYPNPNLVGQNWLRNREIRRQHRERRKYQGLLTPAELHDQRSELAEERPRDQFGRFLPEPNAPYHRKRRGPPPLTPEQLHNERSELAEERPRDQFGRFLPYTNGERKRSRSRSRGRRKVVFGGAIYNDGGGELLPFEGVRRRRRRSRSLSGYNLTPAELSDERSLLAELRPRNQYGQFVPESDSEANFVYNEAIGDLRRDFPNLGSPDYIQQQPQQIEYDSLPDAYVPRKSLTGRRSRSRRRRPRARYDVPEGPIVYEPGARPSRGRSRTEYYSPPPVIYSSSRKPSQPFGFDQETRHDFDYAADVRILPTEQAC